MGAGKRQWQELADELATRSLEAGNATGWFDQVYAAGRSGSATMPWDRSAANALLVEWTERLSGEVAGLSCAIVGCGLGADAEHCAGLGFTTTAFDIAPVAVEIARQRHPRSTVTYVVADLFAPPPQWHRSFDLVVDLFTVQALPRTLRTAAVSALAALVADRGTLLEIAAVTEEPGAVVGPPWPLTPGDVDCFATDGLRERRRELIETDDGRRWRVEWTRPDPAVVTRLRAAGCVFAEDEAAVLAESAQSPAELTRMIDDRVAGRPVEQIVGWAEFCGLRISVEPGVFVPRRRTELLVQQAIAVIRGHARAPVIVELCCGAGGIAVAMATALGEVELHAADIDPAAVHCARRNLRVVGGQVYEGDLYAALPASLRGRVDVLLANVPYVPSDAIGLMPAEARDHEPRVALDGGPDGLDIARRVIADAAEWLAPGGHLLIETSESQAQTLQDFLTAHGLTAQAVSSSPLAATVVTGRLT